MLFLYIKRKLKRNLIFLLFNFMTFSQIVTAESSITLIGGIGMDSTLIQSRSISSAKVVGLGYQIPLDLKWTIPILGQPQYFLSFDALHIKSDASVESERLNITVIKPVMRFYLSVSEEARFYYQVGVGLSYFSQQRFEDIRFSASWKFATQFMLGWHLDKAKRFSLTSGYNHFSNGYLNQPNPGLDFFSVELNIDF